MPHHITYLTDSPFRNGQLVIECSQIIEMLANNIIAPYVFKRQRQILKFTFHYAKLLECFQKLGQLHRASTLPPKEQQEMTEAIISSRQARVKFDPCWLEDLHENILFEARAIQVFTQHCLLKSNITHRRNSTLLL